MIKQNAPECVQPVVHYYPACTLNVSRQGRDDSIDLMKVLFIFSQILSPVITKALHYSGQPAPHWLSVRGDSLFASVRNELVLICSISQNAPADTAPPDLRASTRHCFWKLCIVRLHPSEQFRGFLIINKTVPCQQCAL